MRNKLGRFFIVGLVAVFALSLASTFASPKQAAAQSTNSNITSTAATLSTATYTFLNFNDIQMSFGTGTSQVKIDFTKPVVGPVGSYGTGNDFVYTSQSPTCTGTNGGNNAVIVVHTNLSTQAHPTPTKLTSTKGQIFLQYSDSSVVGSKCSNFYNGNRGSDNITLLQPNNFNVYFTISSDANTITQVSGQSTFAKTTINPLAYQLTSNKAFKTLPNSMKDCPDIILTSADQTTYTLYEMKEGSGNPVPASIKSIENSNCFLAPKLGSNVVFNDDPNQDGGGDGQAFSGISLALGTSANTSTISPGSSGSGATPATPTCEGTGGPLSWILCSGIDYVANTERDLEGVVDNLLKTPTISFTAKDCSATSSDCIYTVWSNFRVYGNILLVVALLIIVFAETIGGGLVEAYTIRKMLPRILVAVILINLSIYIVAALEDVANVAGGGIDALIRTPFASSGLWHISVGGFAGGIGLAGLIGGGAAIWAGGLPFVGLIVLMVALPVLLAVVGVLITLMFRVAILDFLVFVSPVAFALYCLPNTEKYFKKWWDLLFKTLLVYPIVAIVFAMANVTAVIISGLNITPAYISQIMGIAAVVAPLFLVPLAFRMAGGALGAIHEGVTNYRKRAHGMVAGDQKNPNSLRNRLRRDATINRNERNLSGAALGTMLRHPTDLVTGRKRLAANREAQRNLLGAESAEANRVWQANKNNDQFLVAVANKDMAIRKRDAAAAKIRRDGGTEDQVRASGAAWDQAIAAAGLVNGSKANRMAAAQSLAATGYHFEAGEEGYNELSAMMADITGASVARDIDGNLIASGVNAGAYSNAMNSAQFALKNAGRYDLAGINNGSGYNAEAGMAKVDPYTLASRAKPETIKIKGELMRDHFRKAATALAAGKTAEYNSEMEKGEVHRIELEAIKDNATGKNKDTALEQVSSLSTTAGIPDMRTWREGIVRDSTGRVQTSKQRVNYDPSVSTGWTSVEVARGWRVEDVPITRGAAARDKAQGGRRPNPLELTEP